MTAGRSRRCPKCRATFPAGDIRPVYGAGGRRKRAGGLRRCPACGFTGFAQAFPVASEKPISYAGLN